jgi:hypothetical protein
MAHLKFELKSPFIPLFSKGDFSVQDFKPLFGKEGKGEICRNGEGIMWRISETGH